ncbi:MAG: type II toxin-antitoxin system RelE/ParE family toxin [Candidatus Delongbacteria bacterium]|nr:type II toxin-antitoxin system RelE/ParE family toxin [Candidatus Delongbacteria bacterium]MCG2760291.1 type II toxin-antitoxin system RelE/ParE family toxin [Candidatus Delongbacteria bacterium]
MKIEFLPPADDELEDAINYYNDQLQGLGDQFYNEFESGILLIKKFPNFWDKVGTNTRRFILKRFPYLIFFVPEKDRIIITAVAHQHRHPDSYKWVSKEK